MMFENELIENIGGLHKNSLLHILNAEGEEEDSVTYKSVVNHSPYVDDVTFVSKLKHKKNCFTILSTNIASIRSKLNELQIFLKNLEDSGISLGALCIQESWLSEHDDTSLIKLEGYNCITQGKTSSSRGGLLIYLHEKYNYTCKHFTNSFELWENQFIEISGEGVTKNIILGNIYRPPKTTIDSYSLFTEEFTNILSSLEKSRSEVIIAGDFNINLLDVMTADHVTNFFHALTS